MALIDMLSSPVARRISIVRYLTNGITRPFRNFLQLEDYAEYDSTKAIIAFPSSLKTGSLVALLVSQLVTLSAITAVRGVVLRSRLLTISGAIVLSTWVCVYYC